MAADVVLIRDAYTQWGVFGRLSVDDFECWTVERPWVNNTPNISCIPVGLYTLQRATHYSGDGVGGKPDYACYEILGAPNRSLIHVHIANFARHVQGCVGVGGLPQWFEKEKTVGVPGSAATFKRFMEAMGNRHKTVIEIRNSDQGIL